MSYKIIHSDLLNKIHLMDAMELLELIPDDSIDMVLCDLPYGVTQAFYDFVIPVVPMWKELLRIIKTNSAIVLTASQPFSSLLVTSNLAYFRHEWICRKRRKTNFLNAKKMPLTGHEVALVFSDGMPNYYPQMRKGNIHESGAKYHRGSILYGSFENNFYLRDSYYPDTVIEFGHDPELSITYAHKKDKAKTHPNQKPLKLFEYLIKTYTLEGEIVLDMTCGSGTTAHAAMNLGRQFICGDSDEGYVEIARNRIQNANPYISSTMADGSKQLSLFEELTT
jgi:site-specific DNA-methyltransferase (adenine-specific)